MATPKRPPLSPNPDTAGLGGIPGLGNVSPDLLSELKSEVAGEATPLLKWITSHIKAIFGAFIALVVIIVGYGIWQWQTEKNQREAQIQLGRVLVAADPAARVSGLETFLAQAPDELKPGINLEIAVSAIAGNNPARAAEAYKAVRTASPDSTTGMMAALNEAALLLQMNKADEAVSVLDSLEGKVPDFMKRGLHERKAFALEQAGRPADALPLYEALRDSGAAAGADFILYKINTIKAGLGK